MEEWLLKTINDFGYLGIFLLIMLENLFPPIPSEVILTFSGFMTTASNLHLVGVVIASTLGSILGALALYGIGTFMNVKRLEAIVDRWGHLLRLTRADIYNATVWFEQHGVWTVFFCRFIPLVRSLISIPAGMAHMNVAVFLFFTFAGTLIWNVILISAGAAVGESWESITNYFSIYSTIVYFLLFLMTFLAVSIAILRKRK